MDFNESKPDFKLNGENFEVKEEPVWQSFEDNSEFPQATWNNEVEEKWQESQHFEFKEVEQIWNRSEEKPAIEGLEDVKDAECVSYSMASSSGSAQVETRKRLPSPSCCSASAKKKYNPQDPNIHHLIATCFASDKHPSVQVMADLGQKCDLSFREVFLQFEHLRRQSHTQCPVNDTCNRTRTRFEINRFMTNVPNSSPNIRADCLDVFRKVDLSGEIDSKCVNMILMYNPNKRYLTSSAIRNDWNLYRVEIYKILEMSKNKFPNDQAYFARNAHPSVQEMIDLSVKTRWPYETIYERFEELRYAKRVKCFRNDTCQMIRNCTETQHVNVDKDKNRLLMKEVEKMISTEDQLSRSTPLHVVHRVAENFQLPCGYILEMFNLLKQRNLREKQISEVAEVPTDQKKFKYDCTRLYLAHK